MKIFYILLFLFVSTTLPAQKKYTKTSTGYIMVLTQGDSLFPALEQLAINENIPSASFTAMGFVHIRFGFFKSGSKKYKSKTFKNMELVSMTGSIAWKNNEPSLHTHAVASSHTFKTRGGHVLGAVVSTGSVEISITVHPKKLQRKKDETLGADVLQVQE